MKRELPGASAAPAGAAGAAEPAGFGGAPEASRSSRDLGGEVELGRQLQEFLDQARIGIHWVGPDGTIQWANQTELDMLGYSRDEYIGRHIAEFHADRAAAADLLDRLGRDETIVDHEARMICRDGSHRHVLINSNVYRQDGRFIHTRCFTQDISTRVETEVRRRAAAERNRQLVTITGAIADAVTDDQVFEAVVDQVSAALGASSGGLFLLEQDGVTARLVRSVGYREAARSALDRQPVGGRFRMPVLDTILRGEPMWIESQAALLADYPHLVAQVSAQRSYRIACLPVRAQGRILGALAFTFDDAPPIEEEQRAFLQLVARYSGQALERLFLLEAERRSRTRAELLYRLARAIIEARAIDDVYAAALDAITAALGTDRCAVLVHDAAGTMRFQAHRGLSDGYRAAVEGHSPWPPGTTDPQPVLVPDVELDEHLAGFRPLFRSEEIAALGFFPLVTSGRLLGKFMVYDRRPRAFAAPEIELALAIAHHVAAAIARFAALAELERTIRFNEMFTGILGHDLRNPLHAIMTAANVVLIRGEGERVHKPLSRILRSGERMARMIDQLLDLTRVRAGSGIPIERRPMDVVALIRQVADELEDASPEWTVRLEQLGDTIGSWDPDRLAQVFSNLLGNAIQHGDPAGGVHVRVDGGSREQVVVSVRNRGAIPDHLLPRLFEPMSGGDHRPARSQGLGLGLFITEQIARAHGGAVTVSSSQADGTVFTVELPRHGAHGAR